MVLSAEQLAKIKSTLTKLMALSASPVEAEAALAMEKCAEIMLKYNIRTIDIQDDKQTFGVESSTMEAMSNSVWEKLLGYHVAKALDGNAIIIPVYSAYSNRKTGKYSMCFIAGNTDLSMIVDLYTRLRRTIHTMANVYIRNIPDANNNTHISYCHGVVLAVAKNLQAVYATPTEATTALVLVKNTAIDNKTAELFPNLQKGKKLSVNKSKVDREALASGFADGQSVGVHTGVIK